MKIVKVYPCSYPLGKSQNTSIILASFFYATKSKYHFKIISAYSEDKLENDKIIYLSKEECYHQDYSKYQNDNFGNIDYRIDKKLYRESLLKYISKESPDLIEVEFDENLAYFLACNQGIPVVLITHISLIPKRITKRIALYFKLKKLAGIICVSYFFKNELIKHFKSLEEKVYVIHNSDAHVRLEEGIQKKNQIIFLGRGTTKKGMVEFFYGVKDFLKENNEWQGVFVGFIEKKSHMDIFKKVIAEESLKQVIDEGKLKIYTNLNHLEGLQLLQESRIAIFPTKPEKHKEGIPLVALEAAKAETLFFSSLSGGYPEINPFEETYIKEISAEYILSLLNKFTANEKLIIEFQQKQREFVQNKFNFVDLLEKYDNLRYKIINVSRKTNK